MKTTLFLVILFAFDFRAHAQYSQADKVLTPKLLDANTPIYGNPYMGWVLEDTVIEGIPYDQCEHINDPIPYPEFEVIEILSTWGDIERSEGVFDWSRVDAALEFWEKRGKRIRLRIANDDVGPYFPQVPQDRMGTPNWVYNQYGVAKQTPTTMGTPGWQFADIGNPIYQEKLNAFLRRFAERYRTRPSIEAVSLRGYGAWAEWHHGYRFNSEAEQISALTRTIDTWVNAWQGSEKLLSLPVSVDCLEYAWDSSECSAIKNQDYKTYKKNAAYDHALTKPLLTFNKDCVGLCTQEIEYKLLNESFNKKKLPLIGEFGSFYRVHKPIIQDGELDIFKHKLNYITATGWSCDIPGHDADDFYREHRDMIKRVMLRLGYRISLKKASLPETLRRGRAFYLDQVWQNQGVGRIYGDYKLKIWLAATNGADVWDAEDSSLNLTNALANQAVVKRRSNWTLPKSLKQGTYQLKFAIESKKNPGQRLKLAHDSRDEQGRYPLGSIKVVQ